MEIGTILGFISGWLFGIFFGYRMAQKIFKEAMRVYTDEISKNYKNALDKQRIKIINENNKINQDNTEFSNEVE